MNSYEISKIHALTRQLKRGDGMTQETLDALVAEWESKVASAPNQKEKFVLANADGTTIGVQGPRWVFHLFGLRHRALHIGLSTPSGLIVLQQRSPTLTDWANALDMAVAGHVPQKSDGSDMDFLSAAWKEMHEEIGISEKDAKSCLVEGNLTSVGEPYLSFDQDVHRNPPFTNAETRQIYAATLTDKGLAKLHFTDNEVGGLLLVTLESAWNLLLRDDIASGLRYSLPRYLDWWERQRH